MRYIVVIFCVLFMQMISVQAQVLTREWVSYFAGQLTNPNEIEYDPVHNAVYIAGHTADITGVATPGSHKDDIGDLAVPSFPPDISQWNSDFFLTRFDTEGNRIWSTYIGGDSIEIRQIQIAIDRYGYIYLAGQTYSQEGIATPGAYSELKPVDTNIAYFVMKFSSDGEKLWGTYYDASAINNNHIWVGLAVDSFQNVYLSGLTQSDTGISTMGTYQTEKRGLWDGFVVKFDTDGHRLWGTYIGSDSYDEDYYEGTGILHMGRDGYLYAIGYVSEDAGIGTPDTYQPEPLPGSHDIWYIMKMNPENGTRIWGTYITLDSFMVFEDFNEIFTADSDGAGNLYLYGRTRSEVGIATEGVHQETLGIDGMDAFIMKFDGSGNRLWGTYFGGNGTEVFLYNMGGLGTHWGFRSDIRVTEDGSKIYICGGTLSTTQIATPGCTYEPTTENRRGFIAEFNSVGQLNWGSYYDEQVNSIDIAESNKGVEIYFTTRTNVYGLGTEGTHLPEMEAGLYSSGLIGKFTVSCPEYENNITYNSPHLVSDLAYGTHTWYHNGISVGTTESPEYSIGADTTGYWFSIAKVCGCEYMSDTFYFDGLGITPTEGVESWSLYPNPAIDELTLDFGTGLSIKEDSELRIVDVLGRNMYRMTLKKGEYQELIISVKELPEGMYILRIGSSSIKFIKQ